MILHLIFDHNEVQISLLSKCFMSLDQALVLVPQYILPLP